MLPPKSASTILIKIDFRDQEFGDLGFDECFSDEDRKEEFRMKEATSLLSNIISFVLIYKILLKTDIFNMNFISFNVKLLF